jgi:hypothetical protein
VPVLIIGDLLWTLNWMSLNSGHRVRPNKAEVKLIPRRFEFEDARRRCAIHKQYTHAAFYTEFVLAGKMRIHLGIAKMPSPY